MKSLHLKIQQQQLEELGILHTVKNRSDLDEAPSSYKDINMVMSNQKDLVDIEIELTPLAVMNG